MQLKKIKGKMAMATCALLQVSSTVVGAADSEWDVDTAFLYYGEGDGRVQAMEPAIYAGRNIGDDDRLDLRVVADVLTGATPNGGFAIPGVEQTFTSPSGEVEYTAAPGETPLDDTFRDARIALGADYTQSFSRMSKMIWGLNFSAEHDYISAGASANYAKDFNNRNTTFNAGIGFNIDNVKPVGGMPIAFSPMTTNGAVGNTDGSSDTKAITDFMVGVTQVVSRKTILQLNLTLGSVNGYQNDPYKIITVVNGAGDLVSGVDSTYFDISAASGNRPYVHEKRPDSRQKTVLFFKAVHHLDEDVINASYRYYGDDWNIKSHTVDLKYRYELDKDYLQPHVRYYSQTAADFYRHSLVLGTDIDTSGNVLVDYASHDYRLAESTTTTLGLKYGMPLKNDSELSLRGEFISQSVNDGDVPAGQETSDLSAIVLQVNYSFLW